MKERGILVIDAFDLEMLKKSFHEYAHKNETYRTEIGQVRRESKLAWLNDNTFRWTAKYTIDHKEYVDVQTLRAFSRQEFKKHLQENGFSVVEMLDAKPSIAPAFLTIAKK